MGFDNLKLYGIEYVNTTRKNATRKHQINAYFMDVLEAIKVADELDALDNGKKYTLYATSILELEERKDKALRNGRAITNAKNADAYDHYTGYKVYKYARDFLATYIQDYTI